MSNAQEDFDTEDQDFDLNNIEDFDPEDNELDEDEVQEVVDTLPKKRAGRPKGTTKKKKLGEIDLDVINDPFVFAEQYIIQENEPIKMIIKRAGSLVAVLDYASDPSKFPFKSLSEVQSSLGAGMYSFEIVSLKNHKLVRDFRESIASQPEIFKVKINNEQASQRAATDDHLDRVLSAVSSIKEQSTNGNQVQESLPKSQPDSLVDTIVKLVPLFTVLKEAGFIGNNQKPQKTEAEIKMELWIQQQEQLKIERQNIRKEFEEIEAKAEKKAQELYEKMGGEPKEKSLLEEGLDIFKSVADVVKVQAAAKRVAPQRQQRLPAPQVSQAPQVAAPEVLPAQEKKPEAKPNRLDATILHIVQKAGSLGSEDKIVEYVNQNQKIIELLKKYDADTICKKTHELLGLTEESTQLKELVNKIYANLQ